MIHCGYLTPEAFRAFRQKRVFLLMLSSLVVFFIYHTLVKFVFNWIDNSDFINNNVYINEHLFTAGLAMVIVDKLLSSSLIIAMFVGNLWLGIKHYRSQALSVKDIFCGFSNFINIAKSDCQSLH